MEETRRKKRSKEEVAAARAEYEATKRKKKEEREKRIAEVLAGREQRKKERQEKKEARLRAVAERKIRKAEREKLREERASTRQQAKEKIEQQSKGIQDPAYKPFVGKLHVGDEVVGMFAGSLVSGKIIRLSTTERPDAELTEAEAEQVWDKTSLRWVVKDSTDIYKYPIDRKHMLAKKINNEWMSRE